MRPLVLTSATYCPGEADPPPLHPPNVICFHYRYTSFNPKISHQIHFKGMWSRLKKRVWQGARKATVRASPRVYAGRHGFEFRHVQLIIFLFTALFAPVWGLFTYLLREVYFCQSWGEVYFTSACNGGVAILGLGADKPFSRWIFHGYSVG